MTAVAATATLADVCVEVPQLERVRTEFAQYERGLRAAANDDERRAALHAWDEGRRRLATWRAITNVNFALDTSDPNARAANEAMDRLAPKLTALDDAVKRTLLESHYRAAYEPLAGSHAFVTWQTHVDCFSPAIEDDLAAEAHLVSEYTRLLAETTVSFEGKPHSLTTIRSYQLDADRERRHAAEIARWSAFEEHAAQLDRIFDDLVRLRDGMARKLGFASFVELGYKRMRRIDYGRVDVERFREEVQRRVVPFAAALYERKAAKLGIDTPAYWDEAASDPAERAAPLGDARFILDGADDAFSATGPALGELFALMRRRGLLDVEHRAGKAGGAFCTSLASERVPYVFCHFNGTKADVRQLVHEMGHAFQTYSSREVPLLDDLHPTYESAEIHSMALEFLTWPQMERFFGDRAPAYRTTHLAESLTFLPYGVAVDHFQHLVYDRPQASAAERKAMWREMEARYLPWRRYGDLRHPAAGAFWQDQRHIYTSPFYYIDYTLAMTCALQFWLAAKRDPADAWRRYEALCARGGTAPFGALVAGAGLTSPFAPGVLEGIVAEARVASPSSNP